MSFLQMTRSNRWYQSSDQWRTEELLTDVTGLWPTNILIVWILILCTIIQMSSIKIRQRDFLDIFLHFVSNSWSVSIINTGYQTAFEEGRLAESHWHILLYHSLLCVILTEILSNFQFYLVSVWTGRRVHSVLF